MNHFHYLSQNVNITSINININKGTFNVVTIAGSINSNMNELTKLQPIYAEMIKNTTKETVQRVHDELKKTNPVNLQQLQDYVLLPLISKIDSDTLKNNEIKVQLIVALRDLHDVTRIGKLIPLKIIVVVLLKQVFESSNLKANLSEELKLAVVECFDVVFRT